MPTNRPFFANFLAAFRAHSAISKATSTSTTTTTTSSPTSAFSPQSLTSRTLTTTTSATTKSPSPGATTAAVQAANHLSHTRHPSAGPVSRSPPHPQSNFGRPQRRGSDSSGEGYRDVLGGEKWYVGGRTASGEERFYRLGMVRRERSGDRLSLDRLSL